MGSEMKFYKIDDQNFVFSVRAVVNGAIRYYHLLIGQDETCNVRRIKNAFAFLTEKDLPKVTEFTPDYAKIITSLIDYCETDSRYVDYEARRKKAYDYSKLMRDATKEAHMKSIHSMAMPPSDRRVVSSQPSKIKTIETEADSFYEVDNEDKRFISDGIATNTSVNRFKVR